VRAFFARRCSCPEDAEDLAQEALYAILQAEPGFRGEAAASTWAYAICRNVHSGWVRREESERRKLEAAARELDAAGPCAAERVTAPPDLDLDLAKALSTLRASELELYRLHFVEGRKVKEMASILGKPEGTVKYLLSELRARVRELLS
jgi:RNA polymerase sigma-70 factor (ECF subfamily)